MQLISTNSWSVAVTAALTKPLVHTNNSSISGTDVVDILQVVDEEWNQGQAAEPKPNRKEANYSENNPSQKPCSVLKYCCHLLPLAVSDSDREIFEDWCLYHKRLGGHHGNCSWLLGLGRGDLKEEIS